MFHPTMAPLIWFVGRRGVTFLILLFNGLVACLCLHRNGRHLVKVTALALVAAGCHVFSSCWEANGTPLRLSLLQGNFPQSWDWRCEHADTVILDTYLAMTDNAAQEKPDAIIWPEYAIAADVLAESGPRARIADAARRTGVPLVLGTLRWEEGMVRGMRRRKNVAVLASPGGTLDVLESADPLPYETWTIPGEARHTLDIREARLGVLLCFEEMLPEVSRQLALGGAGVLVSLANNSRLGRTPGIRLAALQSRLRAAETGKYLVRVTNTGITQVVTPCGRVIRCSPPFTRHILTADVSSTGRTTFYAAHGDKLLWVIALGASLWVCLRRRGAALRRHIHIDGSGPI